MQPISVKMHELAKPLWEKSFHHPFITELAAGSLPMDNFRYYLKQDRYYLGNFADLHRKIAAQTTDPAIKQFLIEGADGMNSGETEIRKEFFGELKIDENEIKTTPISPNAYNYVAHMYHELNEGTTATATTALLPCYWLYNEMGQQLVNVGSPVKIYQQFIETYDSPEFSDATNKMISIVDKLGAEASDEEQEAMIKSFLRSSYFELNFWQMAYEKETWGV
ncbi:thiaminase II [Lentilactobacillus sp. Marseille-Q4993]|uniref:thiaminase II n=1 Tax=Lentilactobacillus sp. Marseille-Q4993 TaxID=3039492 RepID=UPI0024BC7B09|nr:thiaminase II [Lentilactobacillus sp. Marseille-Q4993]